MEQEEVRQLEEQETVREWVEKVLDDPNASEEDKAKADEILKGVEQSLDAFADRWLSIMEIEDEAERERLIAEWEAEEEASA